MIAVDSLTPWLRKDNVVPDQAHVDPLPGAALTVQGPEQDGVEEGGARLGLTVVGGCVAEWEARGTPGDIRG